MWGMQLLVPLLMLLGHGFLWVGLVNRLHALNLRRRTMKWLTLLVLRLRRAAARAAARLVGAYRGRGRRAGHGGLVLCGPVHRHRSPLRCCRLVVLRFLPTPPGNRAALLAANGRSRPLASDGRWRATAGPTVTG